MRTDEGRSQRIVEAALVVVGRRGVAGLTHRAVAAEADVPLGSTTYHFATLDDILDAAFDHAVAADTGRLTEWANVLPADVDLAEALTDLVVEQAAEEAETIYVNYELFLAAAHRPHLRQRADQWSAVLTSLLARRVPVASAEAISALYDGLLLRVLVTRSVPDRELILSNFRQVCHVEARPPAEG